MVEQRFVVPLAVGSIPITRPIFVRESKTKVLISKLANKQISKLIRLALSNTFFILWGMKKIGFILALAVIGLMVGWWTQQGGLDNILGANKTEVKDEVTKPPVRTVRRKTSYLGQIRTARELMEHDYYSLASVELALAIKEKPNFIEPYLLLGEIYLRTKDNVKLTNLLDQLNKKFPDNDEVLALQTRKWINERKFSETLSLLGGLEYVPARLRLYQAVLLALQNDQDGARAILEELEKVDIKDKDFILTNEGIVDQSGEAEGDFLRAEEAKKVIDLIIVYDEFDALAEGKNAHLFAEIAQALASNEEAFLAQEFADVAIKEDVSYIDAWVLRGYSHLLMQDYPAALQDLRYAYELDPIRPEVHYFLALALYENKNFDEAALFFEKSLEYDFQFSEEVRWKLLEIFARQKKYDRVLELYKELLNFETEPEKFSSAVHTAVDLMQKPEVALEFTEILMAKNPDDIFSRNIHAWALIANNKDEDAETLLTDTLLLDDQNPRTHLNLGLLAENKENFEQAREYYQNAYEYGQARDGFTSIVNLAVGKYNELVEIENAARSPETTSVEG